MTTIPTEPISENWISDEANASAGAQSVATGADICQRLGQLDVADITAALVPYMAAAAAELALTSGIAWRFSTDDAPVALLRVIAKATIKNPQAGGPHTARLLAQLR